MPNIDYEQFLVDARLLEDSLSTLLGKFGEVIHSTPEQDMEDHIDLIVKPNKKCKFLTAPKNYDDVYIDVKGAKKHNREDTSVNYDIHYVEFMNVKGKLGWLYGKAHYFAFETKNTWLIVDRIKLIEWLDTLPVKSSAEKKLYHLYDRSNYGRNDLMMLVETSKLEDLATTIIKK
jgi:hypothetical protein